MRVSDNTAELALCPTRVCAPGYPLSRVSTRGVLLFFVCALVWSIETRC